MSKTAKKLPAPAVALSGVVFFVQSRSQRYGRWEEWRICSPRYPACPEARHQFHDMCSPWPLQWRLVRCETTYERLPLKTLLFTPISSRLKVLARNERKVA